MESADVVLVGVSRTSKTPTSIYLANRGVRTANVPLVPGMPVPPQLETSEEAAGRRVASRRRSASSRSGRTGCLASGAATGDDHYVDRQAVSDEIAFSRRLCARNGWPVIDVTRRSIEETAAAIMKLLADAPAGSGMNA